VAIRRNPALCVALLFASAPGWTAAPYIDAQPGADANSAIEEITVTSRFRPESLGTVPDSITAFTAADIERYRVERINRVASLTPNLRFSDDQEVGVSTLVVRGVRQNRGTGQPPVSFRVDGVSATNNLLTTQDLFDIDSIEVLRGPQGALYGRNAIGGAILIDTMEPTPQPDFGLRASAAEGEDYIFTGHASGPLGDEHLLFRAAARVQDRNGQLKNDYLASQEVDFKNSQAFRGRLLYEPVERLSVHLKGEYSHQKGGSGYFQPASEGVLPLPPPDPPLFFGNPIYEIQSNSIGDSSVRFWEFSARLDYDFSWGTLTSTSSYTDVNSSNDQDLDQTLVEAIDIRVADDSRTFAQELRLTSGADNRLRWVAGAYLFDQDRFRSLATTFLGNPVPAAEQDLRLTDYAAFGNLSYDLRQDLELTLAFRYDAERPRDKTQGRAKTFNKWQPKASLAYDFSDSVFGYATVAKGFRAGGFNNLAPDSNFDPGFDAESLISYETGLKATAFAGRLRGSLAVFYIDYDDQQFFLFDQTGTQANINVPKSKLYGGELEIAAAPTSSLILNLGLGYTNGEIDDYDDVPGVLVPAEDIQGNKVPGAPLWSLILSAEQTWTLSGALDLVARADYEYRGKTYWTLDNVDKQSPYDLTNVSIGLEGPRWSGRLFVNNLFDEDYTEWFFAARFIGLPADIAWPSPPRQAGVEISLRY
jgi:iron complex outermembrane receptor protein